MRAEETKGVRWLLLARGTPRRVQAPDKCEAMSREKPPLAAYSLEKADDDA